MEKRLVRRKKDGPTININRTHQCSFVTHNQLMKVIQQIYNWKPAIYKKGNDWFSNALSVSTSNQEIPTGNTNTGTSFQLRDRMKLLLELFNIEIEYSQ